MQGKNLIVDGCIFDYMDRNCSSNLVHRDLYEVNAVNPGGFADTIHRLSPSQPYHMFVPGERCIIA